MKKRYLLAICLAAALRMQAQTENAQFGPGQMILQPDLAGSATVIYLRLT